MTLSQTYRSALIAGFLLTAVFHTGAAAQFADNVEDVIIPDCGHWITEEQPQATTDLVVDFLHRR